MPDLPASVALNISLESYFTRFIALLLQKIQQKIAGVSGWGITFLPALRIIETGAFVIICEEVLYF